MTKHDLQPIQFMGQELRYFHKNDRFEQDRKDGREACVWLRPRADETYGNTAPRSAAWLITAPDHREICIDAFASRESDLEAAMVTALKFYRDQIDAILANASVKVAPSADPVTSEGGEQPLVSSDVHDNRQESLPRFAFASLPPYADQPLGPPPPDLAAERDALVAEVARLKKRLETTPPWSIGLCSPVALEALRSRWSTGPEQYQADADTLIGHIHTMQGAYAKIVAQSKATFEHLLPHVHQCKHVDLLQLKVAIETAPETLAQAWYTEYPPMQADGYTPMGRKEALGDSFDLKKQLHDLEHHRILGLADHEIRSILIVGGGESTVDAVKHMWRENSGLKAQLQEVAEGAGKHGLDDGGRAKLRGILGASVKETPFTAAERVVKERDEAVAWRMRAEDTTHNLRNILEHREVDIVEAARRVVARGAGFEGLKRDVADAHSVCTGEGLLPTERITERVQELARRARHECDAPRMERRISDLEQEFHVIGNLCSDHGVPGGNGLFAQVRDTLLFLRNKARHPTIDLTKWDTLSDDRKVNIVIYLIAALKERVEDRQKNEDGAPEMVQRAYHQRNEADWIAMSVIRSLILGPNEPIHTDKT